MGFTYIKKHGELDLWVKRDGCELRRGYILVQADI